MSYSPQVGKEHYRGGSYSFQDRWNSYWHQLDLVRALHPSTVLEVGVGEGVVARELRARRIEVTTLDIAQDLQPDVLGSVTMIPLPDDTYDVVLAAEVLEHIQFEDVPQALREIARVSRSCVVIGLPHPGYVFSIIFKVPLLPRIEFFIQIPFFWKHHQFNGEHYWELGKRGFPVRRFVRVAHNVGLKLVSCQKFADDPGHRFFVFEK